MNVKDLLFCNECSITFHVCFLLSSCVSIASGVICLRFRTCKKHIYILLFLATGCSFRILFFDAAYGLQRRIKNGYIGDLNYELCADMDRIYSIMHGTIILLFVLLIYNENRFISENTKRPYCYVSRRCGDILQKILSVMILLTCFGYKVISCDYNDKLNIYQISLDIDKTGYSKKVFFECPRNTDHGIRQVVGLFMFMHFPLLMVVYLHCVWKGKCMGK